MSPSDDRIEERIAELGEELHKSIKGAVPGLFDKGYWQGRLMEMTMADLEFKTAMLRFTDLLPSIETAEELAVHIEEYFLKPKLNLPSGFLLPLQLASNRLSAMFGKPVIRKAVASLAGRFIIGEKPEEAFPKMLKLHQNGIAFTIDLLGENTLSELEAEQYRQRYSNLIEKLAAETKKWPASHRVTASPYGELPLVNVSMKVSAMDPRLDSTDPDGGVKRLFEKALPLFLKAKDLGVFINLDLEQWAFHEINYRLFEEIAMHEELRDYPHIGLVLQAYLRSSDDDMERLLKLSEKRGTPFTVRLVKGAYWDYEVINSLQNGYHCPVYTDKAESDIQYERLTKKLMQNITLIRPALGSHNQRSLLHAIAVADELGIPRDGYELQMLYGMAEPEREAFLKLGSRVRLYAPVGELLPGIGYLVRRILENTSNSGFLRLSYREDTDRAALLMPPQPEKEHKEPSAAVDFDNAPLTDFTDEANRTRLRDAIATERKRLPLPVPSVIDGKELFSKEPVDSFSPNDGTLHVSKTSTCGSEDIDHAINVAQSNLAEWRDRPIYERAGILRRLAEILERDRFQLAALEVIEEAKPWRQADADLAEGIDFCRYYADRAEAELSPMPIEGMPGESNSLRHLGRGVTGVIAPWNFPAAILLGMTTAALVAGNPVILKPSGKSSAVGYEVFKRMLEAGVPPGVLHLVNGSGEITGNQIVNHPLVAQIVFTGSKEVGLSIIEKAAVTRAGQRRIKRVVCEMGGKNGIIVDRDADLDAAVAGITVSAFGYSGQKCSACSRVIVIGKENFNRLTARLAEAAKSINISSAEEPDCGLGPVIDKAAKEKLLAVIKNPGEGASPLYVGDISALPDPGHYVPPAIFEVTDKEHMLMQRELFGPVLAVICVKDMEEAIEVANSTEFGLTGGIYSRNPASIELARRRFLVGNFYINRAITGALVYRQPFGGFKMSGLGTKAGGPGYLLNFTEPISVSENSMRKGFAPDFG